MKTPHLIATLAALAFTATPLASRAAEDAPLSASQLAAKCQTPDGTSYIRMRMEVQQPAGTSKSTLQIQIKERRNNQVTEQVYQVLFPKERKGEAVLLRESGGKITGSVFVPPNKIRKIAGGNETLFDSDLSYQDLIDDFFAWDQQSLAGTEVVNNVNCQILESKSGSGQGGPYASVRSWIDPKRYVPLRIEKYSSSGKLLKRIDTTNVATDDRGRPVPADLTVRGGNSVTKLDGSRIRHDVTYSDDEFTPEGLGVLAPPKGK